jgi:hypothetical protein
MTQDFKIQPPDQFILFSEIIALAEQHPPVLTKNAKIE